MSAYDSAPPAGDDFDTSLRRDSPRRSAAPEDSLAPLPASSYRDRSNGRSRSPDNWRDRSQPPSSRQSREPSGRSQAAPANPPKSEVLGVFGLSVRTREIDLEEEFGKYGRVAKVAIVYDQRSDRSRGFGFVTMSTPEEAQECINHLSGMDLNGRKIRVDFSITTKPHSSTPGEYMGVKRREYDEPPRGGGRGGGYDRYARDDRDRYDRDSGRSSSRYDDRDRAYSRRDDYDRSSRDDYGRSSRDDYGRSSRDDYGRSSRDDHGRSSRDDYGRSSRDSHARSPRRRSPSPAPRRRSYSRSPNPSTSSRRSPLPPRDYDDAIDSASAPATRW